MLSCPAPDLLFEKCTAKQKTTASRVVKVTHVVMECVALLLRNHEVLVQILARKPTVLTKVICGFLQSRWSNCGIVSQNNATVAPFHIHIIIMLPLQRGFRELALLPSRLTGGRRARVMWATARVNGTK
jgi:hypothetical protein